MSGYVADLVNAQMTVTRNTQVGTTTDAYGDDVPDTEFQVVESDVPVRFEPEQSSLEIDAEGSVVESNPAVYVDIAEFDDIEEGDRVDVDLSNRTFRVQSVMIRTLDLNDPGYIKAEIESIDHD